MGCLCHILCISLVSVYCLLTSCFILEPCALISSSLVCSLPCLVSLPRPDCVHLLLITVCVYSLYPVPVGLANATASRRPQSHGTWSQFSKLLEVFTGKLRVQALFSVCVQKLSPQRNLLLFLQFKSQIYPNVTSHQFPTTHIWCSSS